MPLDSKFFAHETLPEKGQHIRFTSKVYGEGTGVVTLIWFGIEICIEVLQDGTEKTIPIYQSLGDTWTSFDTYQCYGYGRPWSDLTPLCGQIVYHPPHIISEKIDER